MNWKSSFRHFYFSPRWWFPSNAKLNKVWLCPLKERQIPKPAKELRDYRECLFLFFFFFNWVNEKGCYNANGPSLGNRPPAHTLPPRGRVVQQTTWKRKATFNRNKQIIKKPTHKFNSLLFFKSYSCSSPQGSYCWFVNAKLNRPADTPVARA